MISKVYRGGSWKRNPGFLRSEIRFGIPSVIRFNTHGFRIAEDIGNDYVRFLRGGSWVDYSWFIRSVNHIGFEPDHRFTDNGFRVVERLR